MNLARLAPLPALHLTCSAGAPRRAAGAGSPPQLAAAARSPLGAPRCCCAPRTSEPAACLWKEERAAREGVSADRGYSKGGGARGACRGRLGCARWAWDETGKAAGLWQGSKLCPCTAPLYCSPGRYEVSSWPLSRRLHRPKAQATPGHCPLPATRTHRRVPGGKASLAGASSSWRSRSSSGGPCSGGSSADLQARSRSGARRLIIRQSNTSRQQEAVCQAAK